MQKPSFQRKVPEKQMVMPEFVPLPNRGGDPVCGLSRSFWYSIERDGLIALRRLRRPGQLKGRVLLPVQEAVALVNRLGKQNVRPKAAADVKQKPTAR